MRGTLPTLAPSAHFQARGFVRTRLFAMVEAVSSAAIHEILISEVKHILEMALNF